MRLRLSHTLLMLIVAFGVFAAEATHPFTLVIDPGHGGKDYGCIGDITNEKTIVLDVASRVGKLIAQEHPEVKIIYTRTDDRFIELNERAAIANRASADLFISVHVNSVDKKTKGREKTHGASVYTLGLHRTDANLAVAMRENSVIELENDFSEVYQGFDPNSSESYIIFELTQNRHQHNSVELADAIEQELVSTAGRADKGVLQSGFLVLRATSMPAVLVELDFICCPEAERFLASSDGKDTCARAIANAFATYYARHGAKTSTAKAASTTTSTAQASAPKATQSAAAASSPSAATYYAVQFLTSPKQLAADDSQLKGIDNVNYYFHENLYKYYSGNFTSLKDAKKLLRQIQKTHPQAFIIKMRNGQRVNSN